MDSEIIYSPQKRGFIPGRRYANPRYFVEPARDARTVIIIGDYPKIAEAYQFSDPTITVVEVESPEALEAYFKEREAKASKREEAPQAKDPEPEPAPKSTEEPNPERRTIRPPAEPRVQAVVEIPTDWKGQVWPRLRSLASQITDVPIRNRDDAERAIEQELKRREA